MPRRAGLSGFILDSYFSILSILPAGAKLFSEAWLILSENKKDSAQRFHKSSISNLQYSIPAYPAWVIIPRY